MSLPAKKSLGQNFLSDRRYLAPILDASELTPSDAVLEIGPGKGVLTEALAARVGCLAAVELDDRLIEPLRQRFADRPHVHIIHADILEHAPETLVAVCIRERRRLETRDWRSSDSTTEQFVQSQALSQSPNLPISNLQSPNLQSPNLQSPNLQSPNLQSPNLQSPNLQSPNPPISQSPIPQSPNLQSPISYKVVANLPYYITSLALRHLLEAAQPPTLAVVMVQWEVARRICAQPGDLSLLAVSVQFYAQPRIVQRVPAAAFSPRPKVDSAILQLRTRAQPAVDVAPEDFFTVVRAGFSQKRKQLHNCLSTALGLEKQAVQQWLTTAGIESTRRAETLTLEEWGRVCHMAPRGALPAPIGINKVTQQIAKSP